MLAVTKLVPTYVRPSDLTRPRLLTALESHEDCRGVVISAPAGSGRTTL